MKASVKVREEQRPLVRAKVPVQVGGLPLYSGISVGDEKELALHVGTNMEAGPSCRLSYRPNDPQSPLAVLLKTGFGLWGSPHAAPFTIAAEFNLARRENVSFTLRLKPRVGSFSFRKHFLSTNGSFGRDYGSGLQWRSGHRESRNGPVDVRVQEEVEVAVAERPGEAMSRPLGGQAQGDGLVYDTDYECGLSPLGLGQVSGLKVREKKCYVSGEPGSPGSNHGLKHAGDGSGELEMPGVHEIGAGSMDLVSQHSLGDGDSAAALDSSEGIDGGATFVGQGNQPEMASRRNGLLQSWSGHAHRSWALTVHSAIPLGRQAMGRVHWGMRMPSRADHGGGTFHGYKLPVLVLDKICISSVDPHRKAQSSAFPSDKGPLSYGMRYFENPVDDGSQLGLIASMCCSMRNQLHSLHSDNRSLKKIVEDMKAEMEYSGCGEKKLSPKPPSRSTQEEDSIRSQLFEELQKKTSSRTPPKDRLASPSAQNQESIFDMPSEGLLGDKKSGDFGAKAKAK